MRQFLFCIFSSVTTDSNIDLISYANYGTMTHVVVLWSSKNPVCLTLCTLEKRLTLSSWLEIFSSIYSNKLPGFSERALTMSNSIE